MNKDVRRLVDVLLAVDASLPHVSPLPVDAPRPAWCRIFAERFGMAKEECCGICPELSEVTVKVLNKVFGEEEYKA